MYKKGIVMKKMMFVCMSSFLIFFSVELMADKSAQDMVVKKSNIVQKP